jgi:integrase
MEADMAGHIRRRGKSSWELKWELPRDRATGKRATRTKNIRGTKKDAEAALREILHSLDRGTYLEPSKITVAEFLVRWLDDVARPRVEASTYEFYSSMVRTRLIPALGSIRLVDLHPMRIQQWYAILLESGRKDGRRGGLSAQSVLHTHKLLVQALQQAVRWRLIPENAARDVRPPRPKQAPMVTYDPHELKLLFERARGSRLFVPVVITGTMALRRSELLALRWRELDLNASKMRIERALQRTKRDGLIIKAPKTARGRRTLAIPQFTVAVLREHQAEQMQRQALLGRRWIDHGLVCPSETGTPWDPRHFSEAFAKLIEGSGLPRVTLHGLRHSHITQLLQAGVHPKIASERAGHSSVAITLDVYSHAVPDMQVEAAQKIDALLRHET